MPPKRSLSLHKMYLRDCRPLIGVGALTASLHGSLKYFLFFILRRMKAKCGIVVSMTRGEKKYGTP